MQGRFQVDDRELYRAGIERIYDVFITEDSLLDTDAFVLEALKRAPPALRGLVSTKNHVVVYSDSTVAAPIVFAHALATRKPRKLKRLFRRLPAMYDALRRAHLRRHPGSTAPPEERRPGRPRGRPVGRGGTPRGK